MRGDNLGSVIFLYTSLFFLLSFGISFFLILVGIIKRSSRSKRKNNTSASQYILYGIRGTVVSFILFVIVYYLFYLLGLNLAPERITEAIQNVKENDQYNEDYDCIRGSFKKLC